MLDSVADFCTPIPLTRKWTHTPFMNKHTKQDILSIKVGKTIFIQFPKIITVTTNPIQTIKIIRINVSALGMMPLVT